MQYFYVQVLINFFYYICSSMALFLFISIHHEIFRGFVLLSLSQWNHIAFIPFTYSSTIDLILQTCTFAQHIYLDILCSSIFNITTSIRFQFNPCDRIGTNVLCHYQSFIRLFYLPNYKHFFKWPIILVVQGNGKWEILSHAKGSIQTLFSFLVETHSISFK